jgi:hypothetical protein
MEGFVEVKLPMPIVRRAFLGIQNITIAFVPRGIVDFSNNVAWLFGLLRMAKIETDWIETKTQVAQMGQQKNPTLERLAAMILQLCFDGFL